MKTYLILINNAPQMVTYHLEMGNLLKEKGHKVVFAFCDYLPIYSEGPDLSDKIYYIFADYFRENYANKKLDSKYSDLNFLKIFFSDFDRNVIHHKQLIYSGSYTECLLYNLINFFDAIITEHKVDICLYESISNSFAYACYEVAKRNDAKYCGYAGSRLPDRFELYTEEFGMINRFKNTFQTIKLSDIDEHNIQEIENYLTKYKSSTIPTYHPALHPVMAKYPMWKRYLNKDKFKLIKGSIYVNIKKRGSIKYSYQTGNPFKMLIKSFLYQLKRRIRILKGKKYFENIKSSETYVLFPLHMKPEASTSVLARHYCDDIALLKNIAFNLPVGWKLYVKEHFVNMGNLPISFYKEIKKIPNVRLISCDTNTHELVTKCKVLITLTSTMGFEALLMHKPVIVFGNVFYQCHPNCLKINNFDELFPILNNLKNIQVDENLSKIFVATYYLNTYQGNIYYTNYDHINIKRFALPYLNAIDHLYED